MSRHNVTITTGVDQNEHRVEIDGRDIAPGLRSVNVEFGPGGRRPKIVMELSASMIDVINLGSPDTEVMLSLPDGAREALIALGWTPPAGQQATS